MASPGFRRAAAVYFLVIALPAIAAGVFGMKVFIDFLGVPYVDGDPDNARGGDPRSRLIFEIVGLAVFVVLGVAQLPGYHRQIFRPSAVSRFFWHRSAAYNGLLLIAYLVVLWPMGRPSSIDWSIVAFFLLLLGPPLLGLGLSLACIRHSDKPS
jgi:hypothetical protein